MHIQFLPRHQYIKTVVLGIVASMLVVAVAAFLGRATLNLRAAMTEKPDLAVILRLQEQGETVLETTLLRESETRRDYLVHTENGPLLIQMGKGVEWYIEKEEALVAE